MMEIAKAIVLLAAAVTFICVGITFVVYTILTFRDLFGKD